MASMTEPVNGVGPHPLPLPSDERYDPSLLASGDARNVIDKYRYWKVEAIKAELDAHRLPLEIAIENVERDFNMGTIVRTANAFNVAVVHVIGRRQWNKRGAMVTDLYMNIMYHPSVDAFLAYAKQQGKDVIAVDIVAGSRPIESIQLPKQSVLVFGSETSGISAPLLKSAQQVTHITQDGSTRSLNVAVAAGIAMHMWVLQHTLTR